MDYNEFTQNILPKLNEIRSFKGRKEYLKQTLARIGAGTGRVVYDIDGTKVIKLALNAKGIAQNEVELGVGSYDDTHDIVTIVYDGADDDSWIISEKAKKVNENRIKDLTDISNLYDISLYLGILKTENSGRNSSYYIDDKVRESLNENEFFQDLFNLMMNYDQSAGDFNRASTYGEVMRNGQPTIVLTDYGLNDEVYDIHYSPQRKQRMYELYNFADGNDDILSDIGCTGEIRQGMWAQVPYGVGDGDNVINEQLADFIIGRDRYPNQPMHVIPTMVESFHECVNNLKGYLNHVDDKKKFYENLLKLQEYLISQHAYDRDELGDIVYGVRNDGMNEGGDSLFSFSNSIGTDGFPVYNPIEGSASIRNNLNANSSMYNEDLEYSHVDDATKDAYMLDEEMVSKFYGNNGAEYEIYKNPKTFKNFSSDVRGLVDVKMGDLYVIDDSNLLHMDIARLLNIKLNFRKPSDFRDLYSAHDYLPVERKGNSNAFDLSSVYGMRRYREFLNGVNISSILNNAKIKNPTLQFQTNNLKNKEHAEWAINERVMSSMKGSKSVYIKDKCRLGGKGDGTSVACNQGDMDNIILKSITEEIDAKEGIGDGAFETVIKGKRNVGLVVTHNKQNVIDYLKSKKINLIPVKQRNHPAGTYIIYTDNGAADAKKLHDFMITKGEYVKDESPEEARYIGKLLGYTDASIEQYVRRNIEMGSYTTHLPPSINPNSKQEFDESLGNTKKSVNFASMNKRDILSLDELPFKEEVESLGGKIFSVGGAVRDKFLGKESKDLDILITGIPMDKLENLLNKYGEVNSVGKSFGVIKFKPKGASKDDEDIDIAIPRTEKPTGEGGHKGFEVSSDHELPIEKDLERRDFTINAIAKNSKGEVIDPYNGQQDLKDKIIRIVNPIAFSDDPLRMLRAVQFAARFDFTIEPKTMELIKKNAARIKEIPSERLLIEFDKIIKKGDARKGAQLLKDTGLYEQIFGRDIYQALIDNSPFNNVKTMGEFIYLLSRTMEYPADFYLSKFSTDDAKRDKIYKEIKSLELAYDNRFNNPIGARSIAYNINSISPEMLNSNVLPKFVKLAAQELLSGEYPKSLKELAVNGNDLTKLGLKGEEIGNTLKSMLLKVYSDRVPNDKEELLKAMTDDNYGKESDKVSYSGVVLNEESVNKLVKVFKPMIPEDWEIVAHHMTINMGSIAPEYKKDLGSTVTLKVVDYAMDDMVIAVGVEGYSITNDKAHITIAINRDNDATPVSSKNLTNWKPVPVDLTVDGVIEEIPLNPEQLNEAVNSDRIEYGCLMAYLDIPNWNNLITKINKNDIYDKEGFGVEEEPHVTILYGFHDEVKSKEVFDLIEKTHGLKPFSVMLTKISIFENDDEYDVVKFDVKSNTLNEMNKSMKSLSHTSTFPNYNPHVTIAYVKKGNGKKYIKELNKEYHIKSNSLVYTDSDFNKDSVKLKN